MMMGAVVKHYWAKNMGLQPEDVCLVGLWQRVVAEGVALARRWRLAAVGTCSAGAADTEGGIRHRGFSIAAGGKLHAA